MYGMKKSKTMKVMIDTNVVLDVLYNRKEFIDDSAIVLKMCESGDIEGVISSLSICNIIYHARKRIGSKNAKLMVKSLTTIFEIDDIYAQDCKKALDLEWTDYEDCIQYLTAKRNVCDFIVTRNESDFKNSDIQVISPSDFIKLKRHSA